MAEYKSLCAIPEQSVMFVRKNISNKPIRFLKEPLGRPKDREIISKIYQCDMVHSPAPSFHGHQILHHAPKIEHSKKSHWELFSTATIVLRIPCLTVLYPKGRQLDLICFILKQVEGLRIRLVWKLSFTFVA